MSDTPTPTCPDATVVIITRNRKDVAANAVRSALEQEGSVEVIVIDDASDDDTAADLRARFPTAKVQRSPAREGYIVHRNRAALMARGPVIVSIDDDAIFGATDTVRRVVEAFADSRVGAVSIPHVNIEDGKRTNGSTFAPNATGFWVVAAFVGTAYALRRDLFLKLGGFEAQLLHWSEEDEYCRRMLGAGGVCRAISTTPIEHFPYPRGRHSRRETMLIARNRIVAAWTTVPMPYLFGRWLYVTAGTPFQARSPGMFCHLAEGLVRGFGILLSANRPPRRRMTVASYRLYEELKRLKIAPIATIAERLETVTTLPRSLDPERSSWTLNRLRSLAAC